MSLALSTLVGVVLAGMLLRMPIGFSMLMAGVAYLLVKGQDLQGSWRSR
jgi:predicted phage tail protein